MLNVTGTNITGANTSIAKSSGANSILPDHRASFMNVTNYETPPAAAATSWNATSQHPELSGDTSGECLGIIQTPATKATSRRVARTSSLSIMPEL